MLPMQFGKFQRSENLAVMLTQSACVGIGMSSVTKASHTAEHVSGTILLTVALPHRNDFEIVSKESPVAKNLKEQSRLT